MTNSTVLSRFTFLSNSKVYKFTSLIWLHSLISFNSPTYSSVKQSQWTYLVLHYHLFQQSHLFNSVTNSVVLSNFTFISHSTVPHIQQCHKFSCIIYFQSHISFNSPNNIQQCGNFNILIFLTLYLIQQFHVFISKTKSMVLSRFTLSSLSTVALIQQCHKFSSII